MSLDRDFYNVKRCRVNVLYLKFNFLSENKKTFCRPFYALIRTQIPAEHNIQQASFTLTLEKKVRG